jgi:uncharacterized membrane protein
MLFLEIIHSSEKFFVGIILLVFGIISIVMSFLHDKNIFGPVSPAHQTFFLRKSKDGMKIRNFIWDIISILVGLILIGKSLH